MKGLLSPPAACCMSAGAPPPGIFPMVASVTIVAPSLMPLIISVLMPLEMPTVTGCAVKRSFGGEAEGACRNGKYVFAVERVDCDIGRQARLQF